MCEKFMAENVLITGDAMSELNVPNRTLAIMDNLPFLRSLNNECIDLIAIDPPFAANETFTQTPKPPITEDELAEEKALANKHGVPHKLASRTSGTGMTTFTLLGRCRWRTTIPPSTPSFRQLKPAPPRTKLPISRLWPSA